MYVGVHREGHVGVTQAVGNNFGRIARANAQAGRRVPQVVKTNRRNFSRTLRRLVSSSQIPWIDGCADVAREDKTRFVPTFHRIGASSHLTLEVL